MQKWMFLFLFFLLKQKKMYDTKKVHKGYSKAFFKKRKKIFLFRSFVLLHNIHTTSKTFNKNIQMKYVFFFLLSPFSLHLYSLSQFLSCQKYSNNFFHKKKYKFFFKEYLAFILKQKWVI